MATTDTGVTRAQHVYDELRGAILRGEYAPGSALRLKELSELHGVSMSVIREALTRLTEKHLATNTPNSGFKVAEISSADLRDLVDMRIQFEGLALERSIELGDVDWAAQVISAHYVLENTPFRMEGQIGTTDEWSIAHDAFHDALGVACGSPRLLSYTRMLRDSAELYRQLSGAASGRTTPRDIAAEHRELMELATTRQAKAARAALEKHLQLTADAALAGIPE